MELSDRGHTQAAPRRTRRELTERLTAGFEVWTGLAPGVHAVCVLLLVLVPIVRWWPMLSDLTEPLSDEVAYYLAFERLADGDSPYDRTGYLYPSVFAYAGAWSIAHVGLAWTSLALRGANLLGLALTVWLSMAWLPWSAPRRLLAGIAFIVLAPQVSYSVLFGNLSLAAAGMILTGLLFFRERPFGSGALLGGSIALKPIAPMAVACLLVYRSPRTARQRWSAVVTAGVVAGVLILAFPYFGEILDLLSTNRVERTVSLHRIPYLFGLRLNALWISGPLAVAAIVFARRGPLGRARFLCFATTASLAVTPLVWSHTLILALPLEVLALTVALWRYPRGDAQKPAAAGTPPRWTELAFVLLAVASIQFAAGAGGIDDQGVMLQAVASILPALSPIALLAYLLRATERF